MSDDNKNIIKINPGFIASLHNGGGLGLDVFAKDILVLQCVVAGTTFTKITKLINELTPKTVITVKREGKNKFDEFAIALLYNDTKIGYIPRDRNEVIARLMDAGKQFSATITLIETEGTWVKIEIDVMLKD
jgi:HIRAN domain